MVEVEIENEIFKRVFNVDKSLKGVVAFFDIFDEDTNSLEVLSKYRYQRAKIQVLGSC